MGVGEGLKEKAEERARGEIEGMGRGGGGVVDASDEGPRVLDSFVLRAGGLVGWEVGERGRETESEQGNWMTPGGTAARRDESSEEGESGGRQGAAGG